MGLARHHGGEFVLRIEDTDVVRSEPGLGGPDPGFHALAGAGLRRRPIYQMQRLDRYREVVDQLIAEGTAYRCYTTPDELDA